MTVQAQRLPKMTLFLFLGSSLFGQATIAPPSAKPGAITAGISTAVTITAAITAVGQTIANGVDVLQVDQNGNNARVIGTLNDNGINGDMFAGDAVFGGTVTLNQPTAGQIYIQLSVAVAGSLRRSLSPIATILVTPPGVPNSPHPGSTITTIDPLSGSTVICNELLVTFKSGVNQESINTALQSIGGTIIGLLPAIGVYQVTISSCTGPALNSATAALAANPVVASVDLDYVFTVSAVSSSPNDQYYLGGQQWGLTTVNASAAWAAAAGVPGVSGGVTIAVIDTGVNANHEDLLGEVVPGVNWCPSVDVAGYCTPSNSDTSDDYGHGTMVAGIAAAITNNGVGVASLAYGARIIAEKVNSPTNKGQFILDAVASAISDAVWRSAKVINISGASPVGNNALNLAVIDALTKGVVIVAAAGNLGNNTPSIPAAYSGVISVAASDQNNRRSVWNQLGIPYFSCDAQEPSSSYGSWVTVYAPGSQIFGLMYNGTTGPSAYGYYGPSAAPGCQGDGTSFSAPLVASTASLMLAVNPRLTPAEVKAIIVDQATYNGNTDPLNNPIFLLNAGAAVQEAVTLRAPPNIHGTITIDFEHYPGPDGIVGTADDIPTPAPPCSLFGTGSGICAILTTQYASVGVTFNPGATLEDWGPGPDPFFNNNHFLSLTPPGIEFSIPVYHVSMESKSVCTATLTAYDSGNNVLATSVLPNPNPLNSEVFVLGTLSVSESRPIASVTFSGGCILNLDNLTFSTVP